MAASESSAAVAGYYDRNTARFLRIGVSSRAHAIHRGLWAPGVRDAAEAARLVHGLILTEAVRLGMGPAPRVVDFGCGVGGSLIDLGRRLPDATLTGITISAAQVATARRLIAAAGLSARAEILRADFTEPVPGPPADLAIAIESVIHAADPGRVLAAMAARLAPGGIAVVVDDFLLRPVAALDRTGRRIRDRFVSGWRVPGLDTVEGFRSRAEAAGLAWVSAHDLTPWLRLRRGRDRLVALTAVLARGLGLTAHPFLGNLSGGAALNAGLRRGDLGYRMIVLQRR